MILEASRPVLPASKTNIFYDLGACGPSPPTPKSKMYGIPCISYGSRAGRPHRPLPKTMKMYNIQCFSYDSGAGSPLPPTPKAMKVQQFPYICFDSGVRRPLPTHSQNHEDV